MALSVKGAPLPAFLRLIRFAKIAALVAGIWTVLYAVLIVAWQVTKLLKGGSWPALPLSSAFNTLRYNGAEIYVPASVGEIENGHLKNLLDVLLRIPVIVPLLLATALLTAFYLWLANTEKRYLGN